MSDLQGGYKGFYARNTIPLTPKVVNDIHKRGGTILGTSRGGHDTKKIVDSIQDRGINQVFNHISQIYKFLLFVNFMWFLRHHMYYSPVWLFRRRKSCLQFSEFQVYIIGGDGSQRGASLIFEVKK